MSVTLTNISTTSTIINRPIEHTEADPSCDDTSWNPPHREISLPYTDLEGNLLEKVTGTGIVHEDRPKVTQVVTEWTGRYSTFVKNSIPIAQWMAETDARMIKKYGNEAVESDG